MKHVNLKITKTYLSGVSATLDKLPLAAIADVIEVLEEARTRGRRVYIFGNGGSASTASHFASDLSKGAMLVRDADDNRITRYMNWYPLLLDSTVISSSGLFLV